MAWDQADGSHTVETSFQGRPPGDLPAIGVAALSGEAFLPFDRYREPAPSY
jgi:hypothetical protein